MPSQEDYLNELLDRLPDEEFGDGEEHTLGPEDLTGMSEEEITRRLSAGGQESGMQTGKAVSAGGDISDIPEDFGDSNVQEIKDMLSKADRNEMIGGAEPEKPQTGGGEAARLSAQIEGAGNEKMNKAMEKKRKKEEKAAAKRAAKEAKRREKESRKKGAAQPVREEIPEPAGAAEGISEFDMVLDKELLDSIVSGAGQVREKERVRPVPEKAPAEETGDDVIALDPEEAAELIPDISGETEEASGKEGSKGLMSKLMNFLTEEEEEEEEKKTGNEDIRLSDENQEILDELDSKEEKPKKAKKKAAKKAPKKKKEKPKKAKPPKPKKVKKPKEPEPYVPGSRLTFKKMLPVLLLGVTVGAVIFIFSALVTDFSGKQTAKNAFVKGDYETCYLNLYGKSLNETEEMMYGKSESILYMRLWYQEYLMTAEEGTDAEVLDCLLRIVDDYPTLYEYALKWNAAPEVYEIYAGILNILNERYGITEEQAKAVNAIRSDIVYTRAVYALAEGKEFGSWNLPEPRPEDSGNGQLTGEPAGDENPGNGEPDGEAPAGDEKPDELPEESELGNGNFVDNQ